MSEDVNSTQREPPDAVKKDALYAVYHGLDYVGKFSKLLNMMSLIVFFAMVVISFADVFLRYVFKAPLTGTKEYTEVLLIMVVAFSMPYTLYQGKHITVELIIGRMGKMLRS